MSDPAFEIIGIGDTVARPDGRAVEFVLETRDHGTIGVTCAAGGLDPLIAVLTALRQEAVAKTIPQTEAARRVELVPIEQIGAGKTDDGDVLLTPFLPSGSMLNLKLAPKLAKQLAEQLLKLSRP